MTAYSAHARRIGLLSAAGSAAILAAYAVTLVAGFRAIPAPGEAIPDPYFTALEVLILCLAPLMVLLMAALHARAAPELRVYGICAVAFMSMSAALTSIVHFSILTLSRSAPFAGLDGVFGFQWPSVVYSLDILAWDVFFAFAVICGGASLTGPGPPAAARWLLYLAGALSLAGLSGVVTGNMNLRNIGILGYVGVFLVATVILALIFARDGRRAAAP